MKECSLPQPIPEITTEIKKSSLSQSKKQNLKPDIDQTQTKNVIQDKKNVYQNFPTAGQSKKEIDKHKNTKKTITNYNTYLEKIKENICYNSVLVFDCKNDISLIDELINNMLDVICSEEPYIYINRQKKSTDLIKSMYLKIDCDDFKYIISKFKKVENRINKKSQYIKTLLYNCKLEKNIAYTNMINNQ